MLAKYSTNVHNVIYFVTALMQLIHLVGWHLNTNHVKVEPVLVLVSLLEQNCDCNDTQSVLLYLNREFVSAISSSGDIR